MVTIWNNRKNSLHLPNSTGRNHEDYALRPGRNEVDEEVLDRALGNSTLHRWIERGWISRERQHVAIARPSLEFDVDPDTGKAIPPGFHARGGPGVASGPSGYGTSADLVRPGAPDRELLKRSTEAVEERLARRGRGGAEPRPDARRASAEVDARASRAIEAAEREARAQAERAEKVEREREAAMSEAAAAKSRAEELERHAEELERQLAAVRASQAPAPPAPDVRVTTPPDAANPQAQPDQPQGEPRRRK